MALQQAATNSSTQKLTPQLRILIIHTVDKLEPHLLCHGYCIMKTFEGERRHYNSVRARKQRPKLFRTNRIYSYSNYGKAYIIIIIIWHYIALKLFVTHANIHVNFSA